MSTTKTGLSATPTRPVEGVSEGVVSRADQYRGAFVSAKPFKHIVIEEFFEPAFAECLLLEFPRFDTRLARNEFGEVRGKAVNTKIREISPAYQRLYEIIGGKPFLELVGRISGIPDLILDPKMYGGGTHENLHGQDLDAHVDFNYDEAAQLHRRLNLIVYLNKEWESGWGGAIEIHSNPWEPEQNTIQAYDPLFNRAVMFETNEISWHGFPRIDLPPEKRDLSRKSISIYLYTATRPPEEIVPPHGTFYVQRPLPDHIHAGMTLSADDVLGIRQLLRRRDDWLKAYHQAELNTSGQIASKNSLIHELTGCATPPLTGYVQTGETYSGVFPDRWTTSKAEIEIKPLAPVQGITLRGWRPPDAPRGKVRMSIGESSAEAETGEDQFELRVRLPKPVSQPFTVCIESEFGASLGDPAVDNRDLQFSMIELRAEHPRTPELEALLGGG